MTLKTMPKVGDKIRYTGETDEELTVGNEYEIIRNDHVGYAVFIDDIDGTNYVTNSDFIYFELVTEETPQPVGYVRLNSFSINSDGHYDVNLATNAAGFEAVQRVVIESSKQSDRLKLEIQIAQLQRKLEALK